MQISYQLNERDLTEFYNYSLKKNSSVKRVNLFNYLFIFAISYWQLLYLIFFGDFLATFDWVQFAVYFVIGTITFGVVLAISKLISFGIKKYSIGAAVRKHKDGDGVLGEHFIKFDEDYLVEATDVNETRHSWKGVDRVEENADYIYIYTSPVNAHIIPKRFFQSAESAAVFFSEAERLKNSAASKFASSYLAAHG